MEKTDRTATLSKLNLRIDQSDILMGGSVIAILLVMIIPLPTFLLDILLSLSITVPWSFC